MPSCCNDSSRCSRIHLQFMGFYISWVQVSLAFSEFALYHFYKRTMLVSILEAERNPKRIFVVRGKGENRRRIFSICCARAERKAVGAPNSESGTTRLLSRGLRSASQHEAAVVLNCVCEGCAVSQFIEAS